MIPIIKNITVIDENGNSLESTYFRRAKGLVKNERARWVDDETICLWKATACPPEKMEDNEMDNQVFEYIKEQIEFLKKDLSQVVPLNMSSQFQPGAAADIIKYRETTKQKIIMLLDKLFDMDKHNDSNEYYRKILESLVNDKDVAIQAINKLTEVNADHEEQGMAIDNIKDLVDNYYDQKLKVIQALLDKKI